MGDTDGARIAWVYMSGGCGTASLPNIQSFKFAHFLMKGIMKTTLKVLVAAVCVLGASGLAYGDSYTVSNDNNGDGYVTGGFPTFQLFGADNGAEFAMFGQPNTTYFITTVSATETVSFDWSYITHDLYGSYYDPAGYYLDGTFNQLSTNNDRDTSTSGIDSSGITTVSLNAGDTFGWYVYSTDSRYGRGELDISATDVSATPEPSSLLLLGSGLAGLIGMVRRKRTA
jgi:hypothetical protein